MRRYIVEPLQPALRIYNANIGNKNNVISSVRWALDAYPLHNQLIFGRDQQTVKISEQNHIKKFGEEARPQFGKVS